MKSLSRVIVCLALGALVVPSFAMAASPINPEELVVPTKTTPVPWPWPWAHECPMAWDNVSGNWRLQSMETGSQDQDEYVKIAVHKVYGDARLVYLEQSESDGQAVAAGFAIAWGSQKIIRVLMSPIKEKYGKNQYWAIISEYYKSQDTSCTEKNLVTVLSLVPVENSSSGGQSSRFLLEKLPSEE